MEHLFQPLEIRGHKIKNRAAVPPMVCYSLSDKDGYVSEKNIEHYKKMAKGGFGLIIQEATCISSHGRLAPTQLGIWEEAQVEGHRKIAEAVHAHDSKIVMQIHHAGIMGIEDPLDCPSDFELDRPDGKHAVGNEMSQEKIQLIKEQFIQAGKRAYKAGYDGVEIHGCHNYLLSEFFNTRVNVRKDEYGKNPEKLTLEIMDGIRKATDNAFIIGIRMGGFEPTLEDGVSHAKILEDNGIDYINVSYGFAFRHEAQKPDDFPFVDIIYAAQEIKKAVKNVPVFAVNSINSAELAENVLETTGVDMVNIGRGSLVNPDWVNDAKAGLDTGSCLYCKSLYVAGRR